MYVEGTGKAASSRCWRAMSLSCMSSSHAHLEKAVHSGCHARHKRLLQPCKAAAAKAPQDLQLGIDIPVNLKSVEVAGRSFKLVLPDIDAVMEAYIRAGQTDRDPYWCDVWPSAVLMAEELLSRPELVRGRTVCEIGCGLGLAGLAAAASGAREVVLLDREPLSLQCALMNAHLNGLPISVGGGSAGSSSVQPSGLHQLAQQLALRGDAAVPAGGETGLGAAATAAPATCAGRAPQQSEVQMGAAASAVAAAAAPAAPASSSGTASSQQAPGDHGSMSCNGSAGPAPGLVRAEIFDWAAPVEQPRFDVALACDVLYESFSVEPVARVVPQLLRRDGGRLLLADPPDRVRHNRECFLDILCEESREFALEECAERRVRVWEDGRARWQEVPIALMCLRRTYGGDTVGLKLPPRHA